MTASVAVSVHLSLSRKRDLTTTRRFFTGVLEHGPRPSEVTTDRAPAYLQVLDELLPAALHVLERYANSVIEADHGRADAGAAAAHARLEMVPSAQVVNAGHASSRTCVAATMKLPPTSIPASAHDCLLRPRTPGAQPARRGHVCSVRAAFAPCNAAEKKLVRALVGKACAGGDVWNASGWHHLPQVWVLGVCDLW